MPNKRHRNDIHVGDTVRLEHTLSRGVVTGESGPGPRDILTVRLFNGPEISSFRDEFVPVVDTEPEAPVE